MKPEQVATPVPLAPGRDTLRVARSPDGLFRVPVVFGETNAPFVVDTGASRTVVSGATLARLAGGNVDQDHGGTRAGGTLLTFSGEVPYRLVTVDRIRIGSRELGPAQVAVINRPHAPDVIGQDLIARMGEVTIRGAELSLR
ncbi:retroviral-like aspartic protease family protein [Leptolyngbya sp. 15MV]|nr:retroviral-like aspartic protease family protein [Leptolyngbya sp. 15MV]